MAHELWTLRYAEQLQSVHKLRYTKLLTDLFMQLLLYIISHVGLGPRHLYMIWLRTIRLHTRACTLNRHCVPYIFLKCFRFSLQGQVLNSDYITHLRRIIFQKMQELILQKRTSPKMTLSKAGISSFLESSSSQVGVFHPKFRICPCRGLGNSLDLKYICSSFYEIQNVWKSVSSTPFFFSQTLFFCTN